MISNLYKVKLVEEEANYKKEEGSITVKQWGDKEAKKKGKCWKKCNIRCKCRRNQEESNYKKEQGNIIVKQLGDKEATRKGKG